MLNVLHLLTKLFLELLILAWISLVFAKLTFAQVVINEVMPAPLEGNEWVELKNIGQAEVSLSGWRVEDNVGQLQPSPHFTEAVIRPGSFFVFELVHKLNNTGDTLTLKDAVGEMVDQVTYTSSSATQSWNRSGDTQPALVLSAPSKGAENTFPSPNPPQPSPSLPSPSLLPTPVTSPLPSTSPSTPLPVHPHSPVPFPSPTQVPTLQPIRLSEIVACPETSAKEWVEFYNPNPQVVLLTGWKLRDSSGNSRNLELALPSQGYALFELSTGILNNEGDALLIFNEHGQELIHVELPACTKGESTIFTTNGWQQTLEPTPLQENIFVATHSDDEPTSYSLELGQTSLANTSFNTSGQITDSDLTSLGAAMNFDLPLIPDGLTNDDALTTVPTSLYALPQLVASSPRPTEAAALDTEVSGAPLSDTSPVPSRTWLAFLFASSIGLLAVSGYCLYQWYTERYVNESLEAF